MTELPEIDGMQKLIAFVTQHKDKIPVDNHTVDLFIVDAKKSVNVFAENSDNITIPYPEVAQKTIHINLHILEPAIRITLLNSDNQLKNVEVKLRFGNKYKELPTSKYLTVLKIDTNNQLRTKLWEKITNIITTTIGSENILRWEDLTNNSQIYVLNRTNNYILNSKN